MRLTLRTLLAYLDGILDADDSKELAKKIEESEYAGGLVHRLRDVMRRLRLGAPSLTDRGPGLDPNTVAEYLDNTLTSERVTDFEKVCLDSDIHLAEVASCHQILTLVLGEPAEVDPASRQRMYDVQDVYTGAKPPPPPPTAPSDSTSAPSLSLDLEVGDDDSGDRKPRPKPTVPEYLREPRRQRAWLSATAAVLLAAAVIVVVLKLIGQLEPGTLGGDQLVRWGIIAAAPEVARGKGTDENEAVASAKNTTPPVEPAAETAKTPTTEPEVKPTGEASVKPVEPVAPIVADVAPKDPTKTTDTSETTPKAVEPPPKTTIEPPATLPTQPEAKAANTTTKEPTPEAPLPPEPLGRLITSEQVLLGSDPVNGWTRVGPNQMLIPQHVLALPTYRAKVVLTAGITLEILGGTRIELLGSSPQELPGIHVLYGRVVLMPLAKSGTRLRVAFGDHNGTITFADAESVAALEVHNVYAPGTNPEEVPPRVTANLFVSSGSIQWEEATAGKEPKPVRLTPQMRLAFDGETTGTPIAGQSEPDWIAIGETIKPLDRKASPIVAQLLPTDRPARVGLLELPMLRPQKEVKALSMRCLGYVGQFGDMVAALNDPARKLEWSDFYIPELRAAVARDAETAAAVRMALEKQYSQQAPDLYRMLLGYTDQQLAAGDDAKLVQGLKNDDVLAVRVLSIWNLADITDVAQNFEPEKPAARRQQALRRWELRLDAKEIRLKAEKKPAAPPPREPAAPLPPPAAK